ncbi:MAG TPA: redoxin domain-containing protein, partial [Blastocatellia bacterium]
MIHQQVLRMGFALLIVASSLFLTDQKFYVNAKDSVASKATDFELKDQYDNSASYRFPKQKVTVLTFGDRKGSEQIEGWARPLWDRYQTKIDQQGVAVLNSVPFFARGIVRGVFKSKVKYPVLLDWTGKVSKAYGYTGGKANLFVIDRNGHI